MGHQYDMIVVGAGISGLAMAHHCQQAGMKVLVLEKGAAAGGCFHSASVPDKDGAFWLEMGTHTCFNSYGRLLRLMGELGLMQQLQPRLKLRYRMLAGDALCSIPSRLHFLELAMHAPRLPFLDKAGKSVAEYYRTLVGPRNYDEVFRHAFNAVICQPADAVPADMLFRKRPRNKQVMRSFTLPGGLQQITKTLAERLDCRTGQEISAIRHHERDGFTVAMADGEEYRSHRLACAAPVQAAARLLAEAFPEIAERLGWINEVEVESVGVVVEKESLSLEPLAGIIAADGDFYSAVSRDIVDHPRYRGLAFHFKPGRLNEEQKVARICRLLDLHPTRLHQVFSRTNRLPAPSMGHHRLIDEVDALLREKPLALIGNYFAGVAVEDCLERVDVELERFARLRA